MEKMLEKHMEKLRCQNVIVSYGFIHSEYEVLSPNEYVPMECGPDGTMNYTHKDFGYKVTSYLTERTSVHVKRSNSRTFRDITFWQFAVQKLRLE